ncbi:MAG: DeoR/GlpR transcriptional regulator [Ruminococcaceae bacterium]|nr:DeoR/GlpR transcriptional regulator [Oscillospiraceae bacterium]
MSLSSEKRHEEIIELVQTYGKVKVSDLSQKYNISEVSIRKDLEVLEAQGHLTRIHGGAVGMNKLYINMDLTERFKTNAAAKREVAELAATLIEDNDTIMMNAGTTLAYVLRALRGKKNINIVTNSVQNATEAALFPSFNVILLGGELDSKYQFTYGQDAIHQLENYHAAKCILSVDGISAESGLTLYYSNEAELARKMIECSDTSIVVADSSKLSKNVFAKITDASKTDVLVTNKSNNVAEIAKLRKIGVKIHES